MKINRSDNDQPKPDKNQLKQSNQYFNVILRVRPIIENDKQELRLEEEYKPCIFKKDEAKVLLKRDKTDDRYEITYDKILDESTDQKTLYDTFGEKMVSEVINGYNGTIMTYGQTGSGKSYTIFGKGIFTEESEDEYEQNMGIVQRAVRQIFEYKKANMKKKKIEIKVAFFQVYLNQISDLLDQNNQGSILASAKQTFHVGKEMKNLNLENGLKLFHDKNNVYVKELIVEDVKEENELMAKIADGTRGRVTANTILNQTSSRSHAIIQILVEQQWIEKMQQDESSDITKKRHKLQGLLTIIDLAGSENVSRTGSEGINQDEAKEINKSIYALGRVIEALAKNSQHAPYRDSILTEILSGCLGGNAKTVICACVSPCNANFEETYSTLQFASRAKVIKTAAKKNEKIDTKKMDKDKDGNKGTNSSNGIIKELDGRIRENRNHYNESKQDVHKLFNDIKSQINEAKRGRSVDGIFRRRKDSEFSVGKGNVSAKEDYIGITRKFHSIIVHLQEELGKLIVKNYTLEEENALLKEQMNHLNK